MRLFSPDSNDLAGSSAVPSVMDNDPQADEQVINQQAGEQYPKAVEASADQERPAGSPGETAKIAPDDLADSIAYALDGSGPGPTHDSPNVSGPKVITEGITGAGLDEEEENLRT